MQNVYDHSEVDDDGAGDGGPAAALVCFLAGDAAMLYADRPDDELKEAVLRSLVRWFGPEARGRLRDFVSCTWARDPWSRGCPVNLLPAGHCSRFVHASRASLFDGRVHPASTEAAPEYVGYMEGAVRAGERAAALADERLGGGGCERFGVRHDPTPTPDGGPRRGWTWVGSGARDGGVKRR